MHSEHDHDRVLSREELLACAMERWGDTVLRLALNQMGSRADAEDAFQDVFLRLYDRSEPFDDDAHLKAWLLRTTVNRCHDLHRRAKHRRYEPLDDAAELASSKEAEVGDTIEGLLRSEVWEKVGRLPRELSAVIHLFYVEGYPTSEIARILDCADATVRTRMHRARRALKTMIEADEATMASASERHAAPPQRSPMSPDEGGMEPWPL